MRTALLDYPLPEARVARHPTPERDGARLLVVEAEGLRHARIPDLATLVPAGALVVLNRTRVLPARLLGTRRPGGGRVELLLLRRLGPEGPRERWRALGRASKPLRAGAALELGALDARVIEPAAAAGEAPGALTVELEARAGSPLEGAPVAAALEVEGHVPLPPYLGRADEPADRERYQTVFAEVPGSVAAPTAGLHLTPALLAAWRERGVHQAEVTLHVGVGTFRPVTTPDLDQHVMHAEAVTVGAEAVEAVAAARARGAPVVAVGTTVVRALESAADPGRPGHVVPLAGETRLLIQPGYAFRVVDALLTNFHQPGSTLLALVAAFAGLGRLHAAYAAALAAEYRFLSYGDAMWLPRRLADALAAPQGVAP